MSPPQYAVIVPVKPPARGKSRLVGLPRQMRRRLAEALALDTVAACLSADSVGAVLVVTDDASFATVLSRLGSAAIPDGIADDLNGSLRLAAAEAHRRWPHLVPVALCADLPALRPADLDTALSRATPGRPSFVPDTEGSGTTLYVASYEQFDPRFGPGSRDAHLTAGATELSTAPASVRRDVDDLEDLWRAVDLGVGTRTRTVLPPRT